MECVIFDIDGTLSNLTHRKHYVTGEKRDYAAFFDAMYDDLPNYDICMLAEIVATYKLLQNNEIDTGAFGPPFAIFICTGRPDFHREQTEKWLKENVPNLYQASEAILMRKAGDYTADDIIKKQMLDGIRGQGFEPKLVVDDRQRVVDMWRREGVTCLQCDPGDWEKPSGKYEPGKLVLLVGPSCAGKSTYAFNAFPQGEIVSSDELRGQICGDFTDQSCNEQMWTGLHKIVKARIEHGMDTVVDATNLRNRDRRAIIGLVPANCKIEYHVINRSMEDKQRDAGWRKNIKVKGETPLIEYHENIFKNNLKAILSGDGDKRVRVKDLRS